APLTKVTAARRHGAEVILHGDHYDAAYARAREIEVERGLVFIHPFDDPRVIAGQGTIALELAEQVPDLDAVIVPVGGGGLIGGVAVALKALKPAALVNKRVGLEGKTCVLLLGGGNIDVNLIARIIERGLVKDGRIVRLTVLLRDRPGSLARLTELVAEARANVLHIGHDRAFSRA